MCLLVESIKIDNGEICNLALHNKRFNHARKEVFGAKIDLDLDWVIRLPAEYQEGIVKCRVVYSKQVQKVEFENYSYRAIQSLKLVEKNDADYAYKKVDREWITELCRNKEDCDDILIIKDGFVTDISRANIIFFDGKKWVTPTTYLLNGTKRQLLLEEEKISEEEIKQSDISKYKKARAINAFLDFENGDDIAIEDIIA
ncbi:MAG: aminotransferase class IV [Bacteroidales bacterium]|nr:aminotransferase class IV [Bacteroidales bacterium]